MTTSTFLQECPADVYQKTIVIADEHTDEFDCMTPTAMVRQMQCAAGEHLTLLGLDGDTMEGHGFLWMLIRTSLQIHRAPRQGEQVVVRTWFGPEKRWMYPGHYVFYTLCGEKLAEAASQWMLVDRNTRRLADPPELLRALPDTSLEGEPELPARKISFPAELTGKAERTVQPHEIDRNGHMNNSYYLDWAAAIPDVKYRQGHALRSLWVEYSHELLAGQIATLQYEHEQNTLYLKGFAGNDDAFKIKIEYEDI